MSIHHPDRLVSCNRLTPKEIPGINRINPIIIGNKLRSGMVATRRLTTMPMRKQNRKKYQYSEREALPSKLK